MGFISVVFASARLLLSSQSKFDVLFVSELHSLSLLT